MSRENLKGKPLQRTWLNRSSHDVAKTWNQKFFFSSVCQSGTQLAILINKKTQTKPHDEKTSAPMMPQSNLFYCCSRVALGIMMAALCLWKIHSADGHVSVCLMWFKAVLSAYIWILLRLVFVGLNISADLCCYDMTREEEVSESHCADLNHLISMFRLQALWKSLHNSRYDMLVVRNFYLYSKFSCYFMKRFGINSHLDGVLTWK